jgi:hypothetical protein
MALQIRRGTEAQRAALTGVDVPALGELLYTTDTKKLYIGDGVSGGGQDAGYFSSVAVTGQDTLLSSGENNVLTVVAGTNITLTTNDNTNSLTINGPVNFNGGTIAQLTVGEDYAGNPTDSFVDIEGGGNRLMRMGANMSTFGDDVSPFVQIAAYRASPANNDAGPMIEFRQSTAITLDEVIADIRSVVTNIANGAESGKLVFGVVDAADVVSIDATGFVGNLTGDVTGDITGNVFAIDTTQLVDATNKIFSGDLVGSVTGDVKGSVFADDSTVLVDAVSGFIPAEVVSGTFTGNVVGNLTTAQLSISNDTISSVAIDGSIFFNPAGSGVVNVTSNLITNGLQIFGPSIDGSSGDGTILVTTSDSASLPLNLLEVHNDAVSVSGVSLSRARGTLLAQTAVQNNDSIKNLIFSGYDGTNFRFSAGINVFVDGTVATNYVPGRLEFRTVHTDGNELTRLTVSSTAVSGTVPFKLPVYADDTARTTAISTPQQGMMIFMQSGTTPPATNQMQVYNGSAWISM